MNSYYPKSYRKVPVVIQAIEYDGSEESRTAILQWTGEYEVRSKIQEINTGEKKIAIETKEGWITASVGDYVIKGVENEFYPCKPSVFDTTYQWVKPDDN